MARVLNIFYRQNQLFVVTKINVLVEKKFQYN